MAGYDADRLKRQPALEAFNALESGVPVADGETFGSGDFNADGFKMLTAYLAGFKQEKAQPDLDEAIERARAFFVQIDHANVHSFGVCSFGLTGLAAQVFGASFFKRNDEHNRTPYASIQKLSTSLCEEGEVSRSTRKQLIDVLSNFNVYGDMIPSDSPIVNHSQRKPSVK